MTDTSKPLRITAPLLTAASFFLFASILKDPEWCSEKIISSVRGLFFNVLPVLFPLMVISKIVTALGSFSSFERTAGRLFTKIYGIPPCSAVPFFLGMISSFPVGASSATDLFLDGKLTKKEAETVAAISSVTGPSFPVAVVGTVLLGNTRTGWLIYSVQLISAFLTGVPFSRTFKKRDSLINRERQRRNLNFLSLISDAISCSAVNCLFICCTVAFYSLFCSILISSTGLENITLTSFIFSLFEFSEGCRHAAVSGDAAGAAICAFSVSFGGLSVFSQCASVMNKAGLSVKRLILFKTICGILSFFAVFAATHFSEFFMPTDTSVAVFSKIGFPHVIPGATAFMIFSGLIIRIWHLIYVKR